MQDAQPGVEVKITSKREGDHSGLHIRPHTEPTTGLNCATNPLAAAALPKARVRGRRVALRQERYMGVPGDF